MTGFWGVRFQLPSRVRGDLRRRVTALAAGMALAVASLAVVTPSQAQSTWVGGVSNDYNLPGNWTPATAPVGVGQSAIFGPTATTPLDVSAGPITPSSWTFTSNASFYSIFDRAVNFSLAGPTGGIISNANTGQTIAIGNSIGESVAGVQVQVLGNSTLKLTGINTYSGGTTVSGFGTLQVGNNNSAGSGTVTLENGKFQAEGLSDLTFANNFKINGTAGGSIIDARAFALTITGNISDGSGGAGKLTVLDTLGGGALVLTGTNTYSGGTNICSCGTLQLGTLATMGSIVGTVTNDGLLKIVNANTTGITSILNELGGQTRFLNTSSASNINITNSNATTLFGRVGGTDTTTAGNATIDNNNGGTIFAAGSNAGAAQITNHDGGGTIFGDHASAATATIANNNNGFTQFNVFSTAGNATIITNSGGSVTFFGGSTGGNAQFITNGTGFRFWSRPRSK